MARTKDLLADLKESELVAVLERIQSSQGVLDAGSINNAQELLAEAEIMLQYWIDSKKDRC